MEFIIHNTGSVLIALIVLAAISLGVGIYAIRELKRVRRMFRVFMTGSDSKNLEECLLEMSQRVTGLEEDRSIQGKHLRELERKLSYAVQRIGMVRFNAFSDAGGELSFAVALLDAEGNGIVVSSIYGRAEARVYGKSVIRGRASMHLSSEEEDAIVRAMHNNKM
ncbi:MAG: hypothetical protein FD169_2158 [Bacillota bacterium]|nr:MAG: hypothetical protein FD169_2158 [Bacillota bacterium]